MNTDEILAERGARYGRFREHAMLSQELKRVMVQHVTPITAEPDEPMQFTAWLRLAPDQREALEMIAHKIARILNGDPDYSDSWHDIAGYAKLVADRLDGTPA